MSTLARRLGAAFVALSAPIIAAAGTAPGSGIEGSAHDFSNGSGNVCSYCHTPDSTGDTSLVAYAWEAPTTVAGTQVPELISGPSTRCLRCHDGTVAEGKVPRVTGTAVVGANGNLSGHHPVGIPYPLQHIANTYNGVRSGRYVELEEWQANPTLGGAAAIRLFRDDGAGHAVVMQRGEATTRAGIECSSCHDPHNDDAKDVHFLRARLFGTSAGDGFICKQCHAK